MTATIQAQFSQENRTDLTRDAVRILRRMAESGAVLAFAQEMEKAVVVRELPGGDSTRTAVVDREVAEVMALNEWIQISGKGRISRYTITSVGRAALKRMLASLDEQSGLEEDAVPFAAQHRQIDRAPKSGRRGASYNLAESPLTALARRKDKTTGEPFLSDELVAAGERLREDFELSQMGPQIAQNWASFLTGPQSSTGFGGCNEGGSSDAARGRVMGALEELGPGLGDVALRCCCFLEGIETTEKSMGWSARSGKIVLRIALQRLKRHYEDQGSGVSRMIG